MIIWKGKTLDECSRDELKEACAFLASNPMMVKETPEEEADRKIKDLTND